MDPSDTDILQQSVQPMTAHVGSPILNDDEIVVFPHQDVWMLNLDDQSQLDSDKVMEAQNPSLAVESNSLSGDAAIIEALGDSD